MEHQPHNPDDREPNIPEEERLWPGEIDLTGVVDQAEELADVIGDALAEAEASGGEVPEWGARTLARALANRLEDPHSGALHHFAVTGRANKDAISRELVGIYQSTDDQEIREWVDRLGTYVVSLPDDAKADMRSPALEVPIDGTPLEKVSAYLRIAFTEADARGEPISRDDAEAIATLLAPQLPPDSEMARFAESGDADRARLYEECQILKGRKWRTPDIGTWLVRFEQYLAAEAANSPQVEQGTREHGDAFRAFLRLPDAEPQADDLLARFQEFYIGAYDSMDALFEAMTEIRACKAEVDAIAERWGFPGLFSIDEERLRTIAHAMWDIVEIGGTLYVFSK
jgi:hypothetical protein